MTFSPAEAKGRAPRAKEVSPRRRQAPAAVAADPDPAEDRELSYTDRAYRELEERIVTLALKPGAVLSEQSLSKDLDIGRTPIREALQRLARDGLVTVLPRRGVLVSPINLETQLKILDVRRVLEGLMARLAAQRSTDDERNTFAEIAEGMLAAARSSDGIAFMRLDRQFNALLSEASHNEFAARSIGLMHGLSRRFWYQHYKHAADLPRTAKLHANVALAICKRDAEAAERASDALVDYIASFAKRTLQYGA